MTIKAIIFDLEGVLMISNDIDIYASMAKALDAPYDSVREVFFSELNDWVDKGNAEQITFDTYLIEQLGLGKELIPVVQQVHDEQAFIDPAMIETIRKLKEQYKIALLTNYSRMMRKKIDEDWKIGHLFDTVIISSEVGMIKPETEIYELTLKRLRVSPSEAVLIDDRVKNIDGAKDFGMHAILFQTRSQALKELNSLLPTAK